MSRALGLAASLGLLALLGLGALACDKATVIVEQPTESGPTPVEVVSEGVGAEAEAEHAAIRASVRAYASALDARDAAAAEPWVVAETFEYYEDLRLVALRAPREQLERLDLMSVLLVLSIRSKVTREQLEQLDGRALFGRAVSEGLVGDEAGQVSLDEVWIDDAGEGAQIRMDGDPVLWLRREDGQWRVDLPEMVRVVGPALEALAVERVVAEGKVFTAFNLLAQTEDLDLAIVDGPLDAL